MNSSTAHVTATFNPGRAMLEALPVVLCYLSVSFAMGIIAAQMQLSLVEMFFMAAVVYSGSGESIALQLLALRQPVLAIFATTFIVNLRYFLLSAALAPRLRGWPTGLKYLFAFGINDETFAVHAGRSRDSLPPPAYALTVNFTAQTAWVVGGLVGYFFGAAIGDVRPYGLDFAVAGMFIALLVTQIENRFMLVLAALSAALTVALKSGPLTNWAILIVGAFCAMLGALGETWNRERS